MKLKELLEDVTGPGVTTAPFLKDGPLKVAKHFVDRLRQRDLDLKMVSRFITRAIKKNKAEIEALPVDTSFVLKSRFGLGVAVVKQETPRGIVYLINTAHPEFSVGPDQEVFLGDSNLSENIVEGITAFHSSGVSTISKFNSFSHFGTEAAAVDRIRHLVNQKRLNPDGVITIYSIDLNIKKPLMIKDANANHSAGIYAMALRDAKIIDQDTMVRIRMNNPFEFADPEDDPDELAKLWPKYEKNNLAFIKKALKSKGYDGLVYKNNSEDKGSLSYVILDPNQARITGKKQVAIKDFIKKKQTTKNPNAVVKKVANPNAVVKEESKLLDKPTLTVGELAEKYKTSLLAVEQQLKKGIKVEMEHTKKMSVAREIALDHLAEDLYYYEKLAKIEKTNEGQFRSRDVEEWKPSKEQLSDLKSKYLPDWEMLDHRILQAEYTAKDHRHADKFTKIINKISEEMDHFCEVTQDVAEVTVKTTTSDVKGLTLLDFEIAMRIDAVAEKMDIEQIRSKGNFDENFADGRNPQDKGDSGRHGIPKGATIAQLKKIRSSDSASPRKKQLAHWQINMRQGKKKGK